MEFTRRSRTAGWLRPGDSCDPPRMRGVFRDRLHEARPVRAGQLRRGRPIHFGPAKPLSPPVSERLAVWSQHLLPKRALTVLIGRGARAQAGAATTAVIRWFVGRYGVNMAEAADPDIAHYATFNEFFTRALQARRAAAGRVPTWCARWTVRSASSARIERRPDLPGQGPPLHARARWSAATPRWRARFDDGHFATLYLSPRDYHRIHMPCAGAADAHDPRAGRAVLGQSDHGARRARPVRAQRARGLRVRQPRSGPSCWCWWAPPSSAAWPRCGTAWSTRRGPAACANGATTTDELHLAQGDEMGRFLLGSTVVLLFPPAAAAIQPGVGTGGDDPPGRARWPRSSAETRDARILRRRWRHHGGSGSVVEFDVVEIRLVVVPLADHHRTFE